MFDLGKTDGLIGSSAVGERSGPNRWLSFGGCAKHCVRETFVTESETCFLYP